MKKIGRAITVVFEAFFQIRGPPEWEAAIVGTVLAPTDSRTYRR